MTKKLKIRFVKFERTLVMQILEQVGEFNETKHVFFRAVPAFTLDGVYLRGSDKNNDLYTPTIRFKSNEERDEYLDKVVKWISEEQFMSGSPEPKIGERYEFADDLDGEWCDGRLLFILPSRYDFRYIFATDVFLRGWSFAQYARSLARRVEPKIDGDFYTWESEVADER